MIIISVEVVRSVRPPDRSRPEIDLDDDRPSFLAEQLLNETFPDYTFECSRVPPRRPEATEAYVIGVSGPTAELDSTAPAAGGLLLATYLDVLGLRFRDVVQISAKVQALGGERRHDLDALVSELLSRDRANEALIQPSDHSGDARIDLHLRGAISESEAVATEISRALAPWLELDIEAVEGATEVKAAWTIVPDLEPTPTWTFAILHRVLRAAHVAQQGRCGSEQAGGALEVVASFR